tara:strand:- start:3892 stop:5670 length:1779 start_codon:yes stop_codon:yes gene_type:complete
MFEINIYNYHKMPGGEYNRSLALTLLTKIGGNVGHNTLSSITEHIDNSLDEYKSETDKNIRLYIKKKDENIEDENTTDLYEFIIYDNGQGCSDLKNLFGVSNKCVGKKDKIGKKNIGLIDSIVRLTSCYTVFTAYSKCNGRFYFLSVDMRPMLRSYNNQVKNNDKKNIEYSHCQELLESQITDIKKSKQAYCLLEYEKDPPLKHFINSDSGIVIKYTISEKVMNDIRTLFEDNYRIGSSTPLTFETITEKLCNIYENYNFNIYYNDHKISITSDTNICKTNKYKPAIWKLYANNNKTILKVINNYNNDVYYIIKNNKNSNMKGYIVSDEKSYKLDVDIPENNMICELYLTLINKVDAIGQANIYNVNIDYLRDIHFVCNGKYIAHGIPKQLKQNYNLCNILDIRTMLKIYDDDIISDITMANKSKADIHSLHPSILRFLSDIIRKPLITKIFSYSINDNIKTNWENKGELDMPNFLNNIPNININNNCYCYALFDPTRPKWRKIGYTDKDADKLKKQYNNRYFPLSVKFIAFEKFINNKLVEKILFEKLKRYKYKETEWFHFKDKKSDKIIDNLIAELFYKTKKEMSEENYI